MSHREKQIYQKLVRLAGGSALVEEALRELSWRRQAAPDLKKWSTTSSHEGSPRQRERPGNSPAALVLVPLKT